MNSMIMWLYFWSALTIYDIKRDGLIVVKISKIFVEFWNRRQHGGFVSQWRAVCPQSCYWRFPYSRKQLAFHGRNIVKHGLLSDMKLYLFRKQSTFGFRVKNQFRGKLKTKSEKILIFCRFQFCRIIVFFHTS